MGSSSDVIFSFLGTALFIMTICVLIFTIIKFQVGMVGPGLVSEKPAMDIAKKNCQKI
ncbi:hypothetical protein [Desulfosporosinus orientis]|uniref:hypothetical protein n=1 Tax=Desulfosporosinus orientis TaxID=1563 RepID=UPI0013054223|nr:hypothetical protein [Desulfosporosinus orientis]